MITYDDIKAVSMAYINDRGISSRSMAHYHVWRTLEKAGTDASIDSDRADRWVTRALEEAVKSGLLVRDLKRTIGLRREVFYETIAHRNRAQAERVLAHQEAKAKRLDFIERAVLDAWNADSPDAVREVIHRVYAEARK